jgi:hypothetical protein
MATSTYNDTTVMGQIAIGKERRLQLKVDVYANFTALNYNNIR